MSTLSQYKHQTKTRAGQTAYYKRLQKPCGEFILMGIIHEPESVHLWTAIGRWLDDGSEHHNDLILK